MTYQYSRLDEAGMCQVPVPECPEGTGTPRPAERQAIFSL